MPPRVRPAEAAVAAVEAVLAAHPEVGSRRLGPASWAAALPGEVRHAIPVAIDVGQRTCTVSSFLLRGPRSGSGPLHRLLLRRNLGTVRVRFCLDPDGDVLLLARMPLEAVTEEELDLVLGEIHSVSEGAFEALVHLGYPGVFPPLRRGQGPGGGGRPGPA